MKKQLIGGLIGLLAMPAFAAIPEAPNQTNHQNPSLPLELMAATGGKIKVASSKASPITNPTFITLEDGTEIHMSQDKKHFVIGTLFKLDNGRVKNLTALALTKRNKKKLETLSESDTVVYPQNGDLKGQIWIFTDVTCSYCKKLHKEIPALNNAGIKVTYLPWPRGPKGSQPYTLAEQMMCSEDKAAAMTSLKNGQSIQTPACDNHNIDYTVQLGKDMGLKGTPLIIFENGESHGGYLPAREIIKANNTVLSNGALD